VADNNVVRKNNKVASTKRQPRQRSVGFSIQLKINGVTTSAPTPSPDHQVSQSPAKLFQEADPLRHKQTLPIVAATAVLTIAAKTTNLSTSMARWNGYREPMNRRTR